MNADQRVEYIQAIWAQFQKAHKVTRWHMNHIEYELARKWAVRGVPPPPPSSSLGRRSVLAVAEDSMLRIPRLEIKPNLIAPPG